MAKIFSNPQPQKFGLKINNFKKASLVTLTAVLIFSGFFIANSALAVATGTITVNKVLVPASDPGKFNLKIGSTIYASNVGDGGTTGAVTVNTGTRTVSEAAGTGTSLSNYIKTFSGDCDSGGQVIVGANENKICTITNSRKPTLTVTKVLLPSNDPGLFKLKIDSTVHKTNAGDGSTTDAIVVTIGAHTVSELAQSSSTHLSDYKAVFGGDCDAQGNVTLAAGDNKTCTITNTKGGTIIVRKIVVPSNDVGRFDLQIDGVTYASAVGDGSATGAQSVSAGSHTVGELATQGTSLADYVQVISGDCDANGNVTIVNGDNKVCTITNTKLPKLTVTKTVTNDNGGTKVVSDFVLKLDSTTVTSGTQNTSTIGAHTVSEVNLAGYTASNWGGDCGAEGNITLAAGDVKTCTITNDDIQPKLTVTKVVVNNNGGTKQVLDFPLFVGDTSVTSGTQTGFDAGTYTVSETQQTGYTGVISGDCAQNGSITLAIGDVKTCTITNTDQPGTLIIKKHVINDNGGTKTAEDFTINVTGQNISTSSFAGSENGTTVTLDAGSYGVDETGVDGYTKTIDENCSGAIANGETKTCTITNDDQPGTLIIKKVIVGSQDSPENFSFSVNEGGPVAFSSNGENDLTENAGTYSISETTQDSSYITTYDNCSDVALTNGGTQTCIITNTKKGHIIIDKVTNPSEDQQSFDFNVTGTDYTGFSLTDTATANDQELVPGSYSISETGVDDWQQTSATCDNSQTPADIQLTAGQTVTCTFTNTKLSTITGIKFEDTNGNGVKDDGEPGLPNVTMALGKVGESEGTSIPIEIVALTLTGADGSFTFPDVVLGQHKIFEEDKTGWKPTYPYPVDSFFDITYRIDLQTPTPPPLVTNSFFDVFVDAGQNITTGTPSGCQKDHLITNCPPIPAPLEFGNFKLITITIEKNIVAPDGQTPADNSHGFNVTLDGQNQKTISQDNSATYENVGPGNHAIAEIGDPDFDLISIKDGEGADATTFDAQSGQNETITITNAQKQGHLIVKKIVTNHNIGTAVAGDFSFIINRNTDNPIQFIQNESDSSLAENDLTVNPGTYTITEVSHKGYAVSYNNCEFTVNSNEQAGQNTTCTITNSDIPTGEGAITVVKDVENNNGGNISPNSFVLDIASEDDDTTVTNGQANFLSPGDYTVSEDNPSSLNYTQKSIICTNGQTTTTDGSVSLGEQDAWVCTITNTDNPPSLTLVKEVTNNDSGTRVASDWTLTATGPSTISGAGGLASGSDFQAGPYTLSESGPEGYTAGSWSCSNNVSVNEENKITLAIGQSTTCSIVNDDQPAILTIVKKTDSGSGGGSFNFSVASTGDTPEFSDLLSLNTSSDNNFTDTSDNINLKKGTYDVTESGQNGWNLSNISCVYENQSVGESNITLGVEHIIVDNGDHVTCTFTNTKRGTLIVKKVVINDNGGTKTAKDFSFTVNDGQATAFDADGENSLIEDAGTYTVTEPAVNGYVTTYDGCSNILMLAGDKKTCTITNNDIQPKLTVTKVVVNDNGGTKTVSDFPLFVSETSVTSGQQNGFNAGIYNIHETANSGYTSTISKDCDAQGNITLSISDVKNCTITNNDIAQTNNGGGGDGGGDGGGGGGGNTNTAPTTNTTPTTTTTTKTGDINGDGIGDGIIDEYDFAIMLSQWSQTGSNLSADLNNDGVVDELDFSLLLANWGL